MIEFTDGAAPSSQSRPGEISLFKTESMIQELMERPLPELHSMRYALGAALHADFLALKNQNLIDGVVIADAACPGMVGDVLASCDGSSRYLQFFLNLNNQSAQEAAGIRGEFDTSEFSVQQRQHLFSFAEQHDLKVDFALTVNGWVSGTRAGNFLVDAGGRESHIMLCAPTNHDSSGNRQRLQECAALACLTEASVRVAELGSTHSLDVAKRLFAGEFAFSQGRESAAFQIAETVRLLSEGKWREIYDALGATAGATIACGESFTFGKLGRLFSSLSGSSEQVAFSYGWYHPNAKRAMGVNPERLSDDRIAEPETVVQGALGLIHNGPGAPGFAVATSGWANNTWLTDKRTGELNDFFSVATAARSSDGYPVCSCRVSLTDTAHESASPERRLLTRELGVLTTLATFGSVLIKAGEGGEAMQSVTRYLKATVQQVVDSYHGIVDFKEELR